MQNNKTKDIFSSYGCNLDSKNPLKYFLILKTIKEAFLDISDKLVNSAEISSSSEAKQEYLNIIASYQKEKFFESIYSFYLDNNRIKNNFREDIDIYFDNSFFKDLGFFYRVLNLKNNYKALFKAIYLFASKKDYYKKYEKCTTYNSKKFFLKGYIKELSEFTYERDFFAIIQALEIFKDFDFSRLKNIEYDNSREDRILFMKKLTLASLKIKANTKYREYFINNFANNPIIYSKFIDDIATKNLLVPISCLRKNILNLSKIKINFNLLLDSRYDENLERFVTQARDLNNKNIEEKIEFLVSRNDYQNSLSNGTENGKNKVFDLTFRRRIMEEVNSNFVDYVLGISDMPQRAFYKLKSMTKEVKTDKLNIYDDIKNLILYIDNSFFLSFFKPFLIKNLLKKYDRNENKYYLTKFITSVILAKNYKQYESLNLFYSNLEAYSIKGLKGISYRALQYGWLILASLVLFFVAPFGIIIAFGIVLLKDAISKAIEKINPEIKMNMNFQITSYASALGVMALVFGGTVGLEDNLKLTYSNFKGFINGITVPSYEAMQIISDDLKSLRTSVTDVNASIKESNNLKFSDIDYLNNKSLYQIKSGEKNNPENVFIEEDIELNSAPEECNKNKEKNIYKIDRNHTFYDYSVKFARGCNAYNTPADKVKTQEKLQKFIEDNREELLEYVPHIKVRIKTQNIPKYLPTLEYDLSDLKKSLCE
ncbi:MAG: hypothetical protein N4A38_00045 [Candidatus Gracilibacteria bacterium]|nr:hypothetical protein [Candidatus Gracilibacteria bacterium]